MNRQIRILVAAAALLAGSAAEAAAQFTGVVTPPPTRREQAAIARADSASRAPGARDSSAAARLTDMKTWVDSATVALAGSAAAPPANAADTAADSTTRTGVAAGRRRVAVVTPATMHDGARAPDTATPLPTLAVLGAFGIGVGLVLMGRRRSA